ncbi:unnamed protein product [Agarophyton chilense]
MDSQRKKESLSSEHEIDKTRESDDGSDDFKVLNVSKAIHGPGESVRDDVSGGRRLSLVEATASKEKRKRDSRNSANVSPIGGVRLAEWISSVRKGVSPSENTPSFTKMIRKNKNFHNPAIFAKMISYCNIDEFGTQFKNRKALKKEEFYTEIAEVQDFCMKGSS